MIRKIKTVLDYIVVILAVLVTIFYAVDIVIGAKYALKITYNMSNMTNVPEIMYFPLFIATLQVNVPLPQPVNLNMLSLVFIVLYILFFSLALSREKNLLEAMRKRRIQDNDMLSTTLYLSITLILMIVIEFIQQARGIETGELAAENEYLRYVSALIAPIPEEIGFRLTLLGVVSLAMYIAMYYKELSIKGFFYSLWKPYKLVEEYGAPERFMDTLYTFTIISGLFFGLAHYLSSGGWGIGKVTTATLAGIILGYLYVRHGFYSAVLGHAFFNVFLLSIYYMESVAQGYWSIIFEGIYLVILILGGLGLIHMSLNLFIGESSSPAEEPHVD